MRLSSVLIVFVVNWFCWACQSGAGGGDCPQGKPRPLFAKDMKGVANYSFEVQGNNSTEHAAFPELALELDLLESGCERKTQEIRLTLLPYEGQLEEIPHASACAQVLGESLVNIAEIAPEKLLSLRQWGMVIGSNHHRIQYNTPFPLPDQPFTVQLDKLQQPKSILLTLVIKNND